MRPAQYNLTVYQYTDFKKSFTWKSGNPLTTVSLAGCAARMMARVNHADRLPLISLTTTANAQGILLVEPVVNGVLQQGKIQVKLFKAFTATLQPCMVPFWQLFVDFPSGGPTDPLVIGRITIVPEDVH